MEAGWAPGAVGNWETGASGWILWVSLAIMLGDSLTSLSLLLATSFQSSLAGRHALKPSSPMLAVSDAVCALCYCSWGSSMSGATSMHHRFPSTWVILLELCTGRACVSSQTRQRSANPFPLSGGWGA